MGTPQRSSSYLFSTEEKCNFQHNLLSIPSRPKPTTMYEARYNNINQPHLTLRQFSSETAP